MAMSLFSKNPAGACSRDARTLLANNVFACVTYCSRTRVGVMPIVMIQVTREATKPGNQVTSCKGRKKETTLKRNNTDALS